MFNLSDWYTIDQAVAKLGITKQAIRHAARPTENRAAAIKTHKIGKTTLYFKIHVNEYKVRPRYRKEPTA